MAIKLLIWDLDDTIWRGTLADGDAVQLNERRADFVRAFNRCGLVSAICSKNDFTAAMERLRSFGLWDEFVFPRIAFTPKGAAVKQLIEDMQLRPVNVLFIDDNVHNLEEVRATVPQITVVNSSLPECDDLLQSILEENKNVVKSRVEEYRVLQAKVSDRQAQTGSNEEFLRSCDIHVVVTRWMDNLDFSPRIEELINRSNQLNYTESRVDSGSLPDKIMDIRHYDTRSVFAWDKYGYYGLVGFAMVDAEAGMLVHFVFSCRAMHMGLESFLISNLKTRYSTLDCSQVKKTFPLERPDWITEERFLDSQMRSAILDEELPDSRKHIGLRIMYDCQSGGIAHFSRYRNESDFDNLPRLFSMPMMITGEYASQNYPSHLVYGAGTDYLDWRWAETGLTVTKEIYADCVQRFLDFISLKGRKILVFLAPDGGTEDKYHPVVHPSRTCTRERIREFNAVWRAVANGSPATVTLVDLSQIIRDEEMLDANHYYAGFLKRLAEIVDQWYES